MNQSEAGCGACTSEMAEVARSVASLPGIAAVRKASFTPDSPTNGDDAYVSVDVEVGHPDDLADEVAAAVWRSQVAPLDSITVVLVTDGTQQDRHHYDVRRDGSQHASYVEQWGERPVG